MTHKEQQALLAYRRIRGLIISKVESEISELKDVLGSHDVFGMNEHYQYRKKELEEILNIISNDD